MFGVQKKIGDAARKAGVVVASLILVTVGTGFLTVAAWLVLSEMRDATFAAGVIGMVYVGAAAVVLAMGLSNRSRNVTPDATPVSVTAQSPTQLVVLSFLQGLEQGRNARRAA